MFVHFSSIELSSVGRSRHRYLTEGQRVEFDAVSGLKGPRTTRVRPVVAENPIQPVHEGPSDGAEMTARMGRGPVIPLHIVRADAPATPSRE